MKNASLITTIIALLVGVAGGYLLGNKSATSEGAVNENKTMRNQRRKVSDEKQRKIN